MGPDVDNMCCTGNGREYLLSRHFEDKYLFFELFNLFSREIPFDREPVFLCIGIDRSAGDCFGPLTGTLLKQLGVPNVFGTLDCPVHAGNVGEICSGLGKAASFFVAVDASLGSIRELGYLKVKRGPVLPGRALGKDLPPVGDISVTLNVNISGSGNYFLLQNASMNIVYKGASVLAKSIFTALHIHKKKLQCSGPNCVN